VFVPVGSSNGATVVAFDKRSGKELWRSLNDETAYSSLMVANLAGVKQCIAFTADALAGLEARTGKVLWRLPLRTAAKRHAATPVIVGTDLVVVNSHSLGVTAVRITRDGDRFKASEAWANRTLKINLSTPVLANGHLFCQGANKDYVCMDAATGMLKWTKPGFGSGTKDYCSSILAGNNLLVLTEGGQLVLLSASPEKYNELGRLQVCGNTWSHMALANGKLYVRDGRALLCLDLHRRKET
jgi:outer membrane protein assembly factor BamB